MKLDWSIPLTYPIVVTRPGLRAELSTVGCAANFIAEYVPPSSRDGEVLSVISAVVQAARKTQADDVLLAAFAIEALLSARGFRVERICGTKGIEDAEAHESAPIRPILDMAPLMMPI